MNNTNQPTCSKPTPADASASNDTNTLKEYEVSLTFTQYSQATVIIEAASLEEAHEKARGISAEEIDDWDAFDGEIDVMDVLPVEGGQSHE